MNELVDATNLSCVQRLRTFVTDGQAAFFVGSGLSQPPYPSWRNLVPQINAFFGDNGFNGASEIAIPTLGEINDLPPAELQSIFQRFRDLNPKVYVDCIKAIFEADPGMANRCLVKILKMRPALIVTVNFDVAIEAAAADCGIEIDTRFFPKMRYIGQDKENVPVVMHLHGKFHEELYEDPDRLILHTSAYRQWYEEGDQVIKHMFSEIFLRYDVVFIGTSLSEPEMADFFKAFQNHRRTTNNRRKRIALLGTKARENPIDIDQSRRVLREEQARDITEGDETGIDRVRFFPKGELYPGLHEILSDALGQSLVVPEPKTIWNDAI